MKILFCVEFYYPSVGGAQEVVRQIAERLQAFGHAVSVATTRMPTRRFTEHNGVSLVEFDISGNLVYGLHGEADRYRQFLVSSDFDIVIFYAAQQWTFDAAWPVMERIRARKIFVPCGYSNLFDAAYRSYFNELPITIRKMSGIVYHAESYRDVNFGAARGLDKGTFIPNGADVGEFSVPKDSNFRQSLSISSDAFMMLTVGTMTGLKGHLELVQGFAEADFGQRSAVLILNGNMPENSHQPICVGKHMLALLRRAGAADSMRRGVNFLFNWRNRRDGVSGLVNTWADKINSEQGEKKKVIITNLPRGRLIQAYLNSDLFVFASNIEYSPLVLYEACAAGLPFLTVPVGNAEEIAKWTKGGDVCTAKVDECGYTRVDPAELARRMEELANDSERLIRLGKNGHEASRQRYNWNLIAREYERLCYRCFPPVVPNPAHQENALGH
ncbi:MAG: glycosyltransferase family 4 protein [Rhodocyclaceae bacterium]|nr:glycosyltransferase family 4 protein [Rhodocyclaceae bacterium]